MNWELVDAGFGLAGEVAVGRMEQKILHYLKVSFPFFMKGIKKLIPSCLFRLRHSNVVIVSLPEHQ